MIVQYFLILLFLPLLTASAGLFDLAEYRRVSYDATIGEDFFWFAPELDIREVTPDNIDAFEKQLTDKLPDESFPNYVFITSAGGQRFACSIPEVEELKKPNTPRTSKNPKQYAETISASFYIEKCITLRERSSWWSYILCRGRTVEQIHGEQGEEGYVKNILGIFDGTFTMPSYQESTEDRLLYVEESYTSGTFCELNNEPRKTTVRYECDSQLSTNEAYISSLVEVVPCQYLMIVKVGSLCSYPEFLPVTLANTKKIGCQPYLTKEQVRKMLERQLDLKKQQEILENNFALKKQAFRRSIERYNAMTKSARTLHVPDLMKKINAEMNYRACYFNLLLASLEREGETLSKKKQDHMWKLFTTTDIGDYSFYSDYDSIKDENRGHLWNYFHDPTWPKKDFPKDIYTTVVQNAYIAEVQSNLNGKYDFEDDGKLIEGLTEFLKTGEIDLETNLVISAREIYEEIILIVYDNTIMKHYWLGHINLFFTEDLDKVENEFPETIESIMESIAQPSTEFSWPLGNLAEEALLTIHDDVLDDLHELSQNGPKSELLDPKSWKYKEIYKTLEIVPFPEDKPLKVGDYVFKYNVTAPPDEKAKPYFSSQYLKLLAPTYKLLSIEWFHEHNRRYFHPSPPTDGYLKKKGTDDYHFHFNLALDMAMFTRMLSYSTLVRIKDFEKWRDGKKQQPRSAESVQKIFKTNKIVIHEKALNLAAHYLYKDIGPSVVAQARERIWKRRVEKYRLDYWTKDYKLRKQAKSMQGMMMDMLSTKDESLSFVTLEENKESKKKDLFNDRFLERLSRLTSIENIDIDSLKKRLDEIDTEFLEWSDVEEVFDLLEKSGLGKKTEVQIKMFDGQGNEIKNEEFEEVAKHFFEEEDNRKKVKDTERAYMKKALNEIQRMMEEDEGEDVRQYAD